MIKIILYVNILFITFFFSCGQRATSPYSDDVSIQVSDHILNRFFVQSIAFDSKGIAWIGTFKQGLISYGATTKYYNSLNSPIPDSCVIRDIAIDKNDNVWLVSNAGLIKFDGEGFNIYNTTNSPLAEDVVWSIAVDDDNVLWLASCRFRQGGLMKFDGENWTLYTPENSKLPSNLVRDVIVDNKNNVWIAMSEVINDGCIIKITDSHWTIFNKQDFGFDPYYFGYLAVDRDDNIYVSLDYGFSSLWDITRPNILKYDGENWVINNPVDEKGESLGYVGNVNIDLSGKIWASLHGREGFSLSFYDGIKWISNRSDIPVSYFSKIAIDNDNTVWVGTGNGIYLIQQ